MGSAPRPGGTGRNPLRAAGVRLLPLLGIVLLACSDPAKARFERAEKALLEQRMEAALADYRSIPKEFPQSRYAPTALLRQGALFGSYYRSDPAALEAYESLIFNYPRAEEVPRALLRRGEIHLFQLLDHAAAVNELEQARRQFPRFAAMDEVLFLLARAYAGIGDRGRQAATLADLIASFPESTRAREGRWMLGYALLAQGDYPAAEREFRKLLVMAPDNAFAARARWGIGQALEGAGRIEAAVEQYEAMLRHAGDRDAVAGKIARLKDRLRGNPAAGETR